VVDSQGISTWAARHRQAQHEFVDKWRFCNITNAEQLTGGKPEALKGADAVIALSKPGPDTIHKEWVLR